MDYTPVKIKISREIETVKEISRQHKEAVLRARELCKELEEYVIKVLASNDERFRAIIVAGGMVVGCSTPEWSPQITLHICNSKVLYVGNRNFLVTKSKTSSYGQVYAYDIAEGKLPFDGEKLLDMCDKLTEQLGVPVKVCETEVIHKIEGDPRSYGEVCLVYGTNSIVNSGIIEYRGWDIHDNWVVVRNKGGQHFYFGTGGHGQGYTHHIPPGGDYSFAKKFFNGKSVFVSETVFSYFPD